jgi:hypothetical protein
MRKQKVLAKEFQFYFSDLDNVVLVESLDEGTVRVRYTKDNLSEQRKIFFIHKLAAEGFIPDEYQWFSGSMDASLPVSWVKDYSWLKTHHPSPRRTNRIMGVWLVLSCILWIAMMRVLMVTPDHATKLPRGTVRSGTPQTESRPARLPESLIPGHPLAELQGQHRAVTDDDSAGNPPLRGVVLE